MAEKVVSVEGKLYHAECADPADNPMSVDIKTLTTEMCRGCNNPLVDNDGDMDDDDDDEEED